MSKLWKKLTAFCLTAVVVVFAAGCSSSAPDTMFDAMREALKMNAYNLEMDMTIDADGEALVLEFSGDVDKENQAAVLDAYVEFSGVGLNIGTVTMADGYLYFDLSDLFDSMQITEETLDSLFTSSGIDTADLGSLTVYGLEIGETGSDAVSANDALMEHMVAALEQGAGEDESAVSGEDGSWSMAVDSGNLAPVVRGILTYTNDNLDDIWDNLMTVIDESQNNALMENMRELSETVPGVEVDTADIENMLENADEYKSQVSDVLQSALDSMDDFETALEESGANMEMTLDFDYSGKDGSHVCDMALNLDADADGSTVSMELNMSMTEAEVSIEAPNSYTDALDLITILGNMTDGPVEPETEEETEPTSEETTEPVSEEETPAETSAPAAGDYGRLVCDDGTTVEIRPGEGFTYDAENSSDYSVFLDYANDYYTYAFFYLYDLGDSYYYEPENYYEDELQEKLDDAELYPNASATEFVSTEINGYTVWYSILTYTDDEDTRHELYSFSNLGQSNLAISVEVETWSDEEWNATMGGDAEAILTSLYSGVSVN